MGVRKDVILALKRALYRFVLSPARRLYWMVYKPTTYGAMMLIVDEAAEKILLVRHAYGYRHRWTIPGGGYRPSRETPEEAAIRETWEEVGATVTNIVHLGQLQGRGISKRDNRQVFTGRLASQTPVVTAEIEEQRWVTWAEVPGMTLSEVAEFAIAQRQAGSGKV